MNSKKKRMSLLVGVAIALATPAFAQHDHDHEDLVVGQTGAGQLAIEFAHFDETHVLPPVSGLVNGWCGDHPGFAHLHEDEPAEDFFTLPDGVEVTLEIVTIDAGLTLNPLTDALDAPGETLVLGGDHLHTHVDFCIDESATPELQNYSVTFRLLDTGTTGLSASANYELSFVPEPTALSMLGVALLGFLRRR